MIALLGSLLGLFGGVLPELIKMFQDKRDKAHELAMLEIQMKNASAQHLARMDEIGAWADAKEGETLHLRGSTSTGIRFIDGLNASVRPVLAYAFFTLYAYVKYRHIESGMMWLLWDDDDKAIFCTIISFYFGGRMMSKVMGRIKA